MKTRSHGFAVLIGTILALGLCAGFVLGNTSGRDSVYKFLNIFAEVYSLVRGNYVDPVNEDGLMSGAFHGLAGSLDPFSGYLTREEFQAFSKDPVGGPAETGLEVLRVAGGAVVVAVREGSSGEKAGLKPGDAIWAIDGVPARQMSLSQVRRAQRGAAESATKVLIFHPRAQKREELVLRRTVLAVPAVQSRMVPGEIGYLRLLSPERADREEFKKRLTALRQKGATRLLLDLRDCTGGTVEDAVRVAGLFVPPGLVVTVQDRAGSRLAKVSTTPVVWTLPVTVLVNWGSAGAAEVIASALRSRLGAPILGETSYGLARTQELVPLPSGDGLVLSSGRLVPPSGESWTKGLEPDQEIPSSPEERAGLEPDRQLEKALDSLRQASPAAA